MKVSKYMTSKLIVAKPKDGARTAFFRMREHEIHHLPVVDDEGKLVGIVSDRDLRRPDWAEESVDISHTYMLDDALEVGDLMSPAPITVHTYDTLHKAVKLFVEHKFGTLPVLDKTGALVGILSPLDVMQAFDEVFETDMGVA